MTTSRALLLLVGLTLPACTKVEDQFVCTDDPQCRSAGLAGRCEPAGYCSFPATDCPSHWRFDPSADPSLAGTCTGGVDCAAPFEPRAGAVGAQCVAGAPPTVDGDLADWPAALFVTHIDHATAALSDGTWSVDEAANDADLSASVALRWDSMFLYVAAQVTDDQILINTAEELWNNDSFELFIDGAGDLSGPYGADDHQLIFRADGVAGSRRNGVAVAFPVGLVAAAVRQSTTRWLLEVAVPFSALGMAAVVPGRVIGIDLVLEDRESMTTDVRKYLTWKQATPPATGCSTTCPVDCLASCSTMNFAALQLGNDL